MRLLPVLLCVCLALGLSLHHGRILFMIFLALFYFPFLVILHSHSYLPTHAHSAPNEPTPPTPLFSYDKKISMSPAHYQTRRSLLVTLLQRYLPPHLYCAIAAVQPSVSTLHSVTRASSCFFIFTYLKPACEFFLNISSSFLHG